MEYVWKSAAIIGMFYAVYKLFLEKETFFHGIRIYFVTGILLASALPLVTIPRYVEVDALWVPVSSGPAVDSATPLAETGNYLYWLVLVYFTGLSFFAGRFLLQLGSLLWFLHRQPGKREGNYVMIPTSKKLSPFSFFRYIVYPVKGFTPSELKQILLHEQTHAAEYHSLDILLGQMLIIFNWFNPLAWLYQREMQKNLEFIADARAEVSVPHRSQYQHLLLKTVATDQRLSLTSNFYNSLIKKRILMLQKNKSSNRMYLKFILIVPLLIAFLFTFNTKVIAQVKEGKKVVVEKEIRVEVIDKDAQKSDLEAMKKSWAKEGVTVNYKNLKYNSSKEIIGIDLSVASKKGSKANLSLSGTEPIQPISIRYDKNTGSLALGNVESMAWNVKAHDGKGLHKKVFVTSGGDKDVIMIQGDSTGTWHVDDENVFIVKGGKAGDLNWTTEEDVTVEIIGGDSTKVEKRIKVIKMKEGDEAEEIMIKKIKEGDGEMKVIVKTVEEGKHEEHKVMFMGDKDASLIIIDGKESTHEELNKISPDTIESVNVWKGDKAIEKYGDKAKDGVIEIKTKK